MLHDGAGRRRGIRRRSEARRRHGTAEYANAEAAYESTGRAATLHIGGRRKEVGVSIRFMYNSMSEIIMYEILNCEVWKTNI